MDSGKPNRSEELAEQLSNKLIEKLTAIKAKECPHGYPPEHKAFIEAFIQELNEKRARRKQIADKIAGSLILTGLLALLSFLGKLVLDYFHTPGS